MATAFILLILVGAIAFLFRPMKRARPVEPLAKASFDLEMMPYEAAAERKADQEILILLERRIVSSGFFKQERVGNLIAVLKSGYVPFGRVNSHIAFKGDPLTVEEKRRLGLNTRRKYSRQFIDYFRPESLKNIEPHSVLESMHLDAFHRVSRKKHLRRLKGLGFVTHVKISADTECNRMSSSQSYPIESVPELPVQGCTAPYCRCMYEAIIPRAL